MRAWSGLLFQYIYSLLFTEACFICSQKTSVMFVNVVVATAASMFLLLHRLIVSLFVALPKLWIHINVLSTYNVFDGHSCRFLSQVCLKMYKQGCKKSSRKTWMPLGGGFKFKSSTWLTPSSSFPFQTRANSYASFASGQSAAFAINKSSLSPNWLSFFYFKERSSKKEIS